ncbi:MAG: DUF1800 domain-containing protein [Rubrivivax sp.]|nr:DUF1800 domain-containing protein [Rubrivivax sp.]MBK8526273.1 DUF1800 domain-containing protein [Rubrivivax sp.]
MDWAEQAYGSYFPGPQPDLVSAPYTYRYYKNTGNYLGVAGGRVYLYGPVAGGSDLVDAGALADYAAPVFALSLAADDAQAARFLMQATLGVTDADISAVRNQGYDAWLNAEFARPPSESNWQYLLDKGIAANLDNRNSAVGSDPALWQRLIGAGDSLRQRMALALSEIFVVGFDGITGPWRQFKLAAWWDLLASHAFGTYRQLLEAVTLSPAMGQYLTYAGNQKENPSTGRLPDENYAREVMQLFSIGLYELNVDGSHRLDAQGQPIETYTLNTVSQMARVFTGWNVDARRGETGPELTQRPMVLTASLHSTLAVDALGMTIPAGTDGSTALRLALDRLAGHANVGPFIGRQLIQRLVTSNPSPAYVARVSAAFADNGQGVRGDLKAVLRAVLLDYEAREPTRSDDPAYGKLREPLLRFLSWARSFGATSASGDWTIGDLSDSATRLGQSPLRSASVFNFFRPGYVPAGTALGNASLAAPEFQITTETTVAGYLNFMQRVIPGGRNDLRLAYGAELALAADAAALVDRVQALLCHASLQAGTRSTIVDAVGAIAAATDAGRANRVYAAILLVLASPEALVQK